VQQDNRVWFKSTKSNPSGNCVEVTKPYRKSRKSISVNCLEVEDRIVDGTPIRALRNTRDRSLPEHVFTEAEWQAFIAGVKDGEFD